MMLRRAWPSATPGSRWKPVPSGPRCGMAAIMRVSTARSAARAGSRNHSPAMPHMRGTSWGAIRRAVPIDCEAGVVVIACELVAVEDRVVQGIDVDDAQTARGARAGREHAVACPREQRGIERIVEKYEQIAVRQVECARV